MNVVAYVARGNAWRRDGVYDKAIADFRKSVELGPDNAVAHNALACFLATCPDAQHRDGEAAVEHATKACELTQWNDARCIDTLAAAYAETGDFDAAVKWQQKAVDLSPEESKADHRTRLKWYKSGQPLRDLPKQ